MLTINVFAVQEIEEHEDENYDIGTVAMQGWRTEMVKHAHFRDALYWISPP